MTKEEKPVSDLVEGLQEAYNSWNPAMIREALGKAIAALTQTDGGAPFSAVEQLSELMRGLEIAPGGATLSPSTLHLIGKQIASQAKKAASTMPGAPAGYKIEHGSNEYRELVVTAPDGGQSIFYPDDATYGLLLSLLPSDREPDIDKCPECGGPADNGHDRCYPPNPYHCTKCDSNRGSVRVPVEPDEELIDRAIDEFLKLNGTPNSAVEINEASRGVIKLWLRAFINASGGEK